MNKTAHIFVHIVIATKKKHHFLNDFTLVNLRSFIDKKIRNLEGRLISMDGYNDNIHLLMQLHPARSLEDILTDLKFSSSKHLNKEIYTLEHTITWQPGYFIESVSRNHLQSVIDYINRQKEVHRK